MALSRKYLETDDADAYYNRGNVYYDLKDYPKALADYNQALRINPDYAEAYGNRGLVYAQLGEREKAVTDMEKAAQLLCQQRNPACETAQEWLRQLQTGGN